MPRAVSPRAPQTLPRGTPGRGEGSVTLEPIVLGKRHPLLGPQSAGNGASPPRPRNARVFPLPYRLPPPGGLVATEVYLLTFLAPNIQIKVSGLLPGALGEAPPASPSSWGSRSPWACGHIRPTSAPSSHGPSPPGSQG